jgi:hypothetical protein
LAAGQNLINNGTINLNPGASPSGLLLSGSGGTVTLDGSGVLNLNGIKSRIDSIGTNLTLVNASGHTIQGMGLIDPTGDLAELSNAGTITASGKGHLQILSPSVTNTGTISVEQGSALSLAGLTNFHASDGKLAGGRYDIAGELDLTGADIITNQADLTFRGSSWRVLNGHGASGIANLAANAAGGTLALRDGATFGAWDSFANAGDVIIDSGSRFEGIGGYLQTGGTTRVDGTLHSDVSIQGGRLTGTGTVDGNLSNALYVAPGNSPGTLTVDGDYSQTADGVLEIEILNALVYDKLVATGNATLAGTLKLILLPGSVLHSGDRFTILTFASLSGTFDTWDLAAPAGSRWTTHFTANSLELEYSTATPEPAAWGLMAAGALWLWWRRCQA